MRAESPAPHLPRGAGGPLRLAAGRGPHPASDNLSAPEGGGLSSRPALVLEPDPLARLLVTPAVEALGLAVAREREVASAGGPTAVFLPLGCSADCRRSCAAARATERYGPPPLVVGYGAGPPALLAAHRAHRCADLVLLLAAGAGGPCFTHLPADDPVTRAALTSREADVLVLLLGGLTTPAIAARLGVSASTARSHCRAVLRKFEAGDRRALRGLLLAGPRGPAAAAPAGPPPPPPYGRPGAVSPPAPKFA